MRQICTSISCSVYVFGQSAEVCPDCGEKGVRMSNDLDQRFMVLYREVAK